MLQFVEKCIVINLEDISVYVFDMLTTANKMMTLD